MKTLQRLGVCSLVAILVGCSPSEREVTVFEDVTNAAGLDGYVGMTFGGAWGDVDSDGRPDLYVTNHLNDVQLLRNLGNGRFADVSADWLGTAVRGGDSHGAAWADVDNDGRPDLVQLTGAVMGVGQEPKRFFLNRGDRLEDVAEQAGVDNLQGRTRMPLWADLDGDGSLDLFHGAEARFDDIDPPFTFLKRGSGFEAALTALAFRSRSAPFCIVSELTGDTHPELVCRVAGKGVTAQVFDTSVLPARELDLLPVTAFEDVAAGDFDNDGQIDLFLARKNPAGQVAFGRPSLAEAVADLSLRQASSAATAGFDFRAAGKVRFKVAPKAPRGSLDVSGVRIGAGGGSPAAFEFELDPATGEVSGIVTDVPGAGAEVRIGFEAPDRWRVRLATAPVGANEKAKNWHVQVGVSTDRQLEDLAATESAEQTEAAPQRLFMNRGGKLVEESEDRGINEVPVAAVNVVAADFDNDMDLDLFLVASGDIGNHENVLLLNNGDGEFERVKAAGGAAGPMSGVGDSATTVDFDGDGFLDLLVANGASMGRSLGLPSDSGGYRLYRNVGNGNHWLAVDLQGTKSNRDGIGAVVRVTAGGVTQMRVQDGGVHHRGQNHSRLHFGLAKHQQIDRITVQWPSGTVQELKDVPANQVLRIEEPSA
jgi:hypothetical protein